MLSFNYLTVWSPVTDVDRDKDPHQSNRLSSQGQVEEQNGGEDEQESLDLGIGRPTETVCLF